MRYEQFHGGRDIVQVITFHVEIDGERGWTHIHSLDWETTQNEDAARRYMRRVMADRRGMQVRLMRTVCTQSVIWEAHRPTDE